MRMADSSQPEAADVDYFWNTDEFEKWKGKRKDKFLDKDHYVVRFGVDDIRYIIVYQEQNIKSTIDRLSILQTVGGNPLTDKEKNLLISKVISFDHINRDF